jgi:hypothetical protein
MTTSKTREIIDRIFKEPGVKYELTEFETLGKPIHEILDIYDKTVETGRDAGKIKYFLKSQVPFSSGREEVQVYVDGGKDEFNEIFKLIFAKIWDEREAQENRKDKVVEFRKALDPDITYDRINALFHKAADQWPGIFRDGEDIELTKRHLQVCVGLIEGVRLLGSNLRVMDDAFEYLLPTEAKKKKGQFFTPRHVVEMCVRMLNPKHNEYVMDLACVSAGFLLSCIQLTSTGLLSPYLLRKSRRPSEIW